MTLLILLYALVYQALIIGANDDIPASPEEIARREPDGDHILQEESHPTAVLMGPDGEVTAAAIRRAEALRYPNRKPDKFKELMEDTEISEIHRIIVPKLLNPNIRNEESYLNNQESTQKNHATAPKSTAVKVEIDGTQKIQEFTTASTPNQEIVTSTQIPSYREIKFDSKDQQIQIDHKFTNTGLVIKNNGEKQNEKRVFSTIQNVTEKPKVIQTVTQKKELIHEEVINTQTSTTQIPKIANTNYMHHTNQAIENIFSFQNQPIVVEDYSLLEVKKPSVELEAPNVVSKPNNEIQYSQVIKKPSVELEVPLENIESVTKVVTERPTAVSEVLNQEKFTERNPSVIDLLRTSILSLQTGKPNQENIQRLNTEPKIETERTRIDSSDMLAKVNSQQNQTPRISIPIPNLELETPKLDDVPIPNLELETPKLDDPHLQPSSENREKPATIQINNANNKQTIGEISKLENETQTPSLTTIKKTQEVSQNNNLRLPVSNVQRVESNENTKQQRPVDAKEILEDSNERKNVLSNVINTPTLHPNDIPSIPAARLEQRLPISGSAAVDTVVSSLNNADSAGDDKERTQVLNYIKDNPPCAQALEYMKLTRPQLLFQIYISMAPVFDTITKAFHSEPGYAQNYNNYYLHTPILGESENTLRNSQAFREINNSEQNYDNDERSRHRRCTKKNNPETRGVNLNMPIAEALYSRQNIFENRS